MEFRHLKMILHNLKLLKGRKLSASKKSLLKTLMFSKIVEPKIKQKKSQGCLKKQNQSLINKTNYKISPLLQSRQSIMKSLLSCQLRLINKLPNTMTNCQNHLKKRKNWRNQVLPYLLMRITNLEL